MFLLIPIFVDFIFFFLLLVFTPTSDAKQLEFYEDRAPKFPKGESYIARNKNLKETVVRDPASDRYLVPHVNVGKHSTEALSSDMSGQDVSIGTGLKEEKIGHQLPAVLESSPKTDDAAGSSAGHDNAGKLCIKEEVPFIALHAHFLFLCFFSFFIFLVH